MTVLELREYANKVVAVLDVVAKFTPTTVDDKVIGFVKAVVANDEVLGFIVFVLGKWWASPAAEVDVAQLAGWFAESAANAHVGEKKVP